MSDRTCGWCGGSMEGKRSNALYCSRQHKINAGSKRHRARNPGYYAGRDEYHLAYRTANAEALRRKAREFRRKAAEIDPEGVRARSRAWWVANPDKHRLYQAKRRVTERSDVYVVTDRDIRRLVARFRNRCAYCDGPGPLHIDHVVPIKRGGQHRIGNLLPACRSCNLSKSARLLADWMLRR